MKQAKNWVDRVLIVVLTLAIFAVILAIVYVIAVPKEGEKFTEFFILGENRTAEYYPGWIIAGQNYPMFIGVGNHELRDVTYTIEIWMIRTEFDGMTNTSRISTMDPKDHLTFTLADNQSTIIPYNLSVKKTGYDLLEFLLFNETVPDFEVTGNNRINTSYRDLHLWINIEEGK